MFFGKDVIQMGYRYNTKRTTAHLSKIAILGRRAFFALACIFVGGVSAVVLLGTWASGVTVSCEPTRFVKVGDKLGIYTIKEILNDKQVIALCDDGMEYTITVSGERWLNSPILQRVFTDCTVNVGQVEVQSSAGRQNYLAGGTGILEEESRGAEVTEVKTTEENNEKVLDGVDPDSEYADALWELFYGE